MLINAEEKERSRVASELHDDFSQRLAILALGLENVDEATPASLEHVHKQLQELARSTSELGSDLHTLSHRLHSSTLESLGLVPAVDALCREFTCKQGIRVDFSDANEIPRSINPDAALCIFRIVQEALRNLKKYSGAEEAGGAPANDGRQIRDSREGQRTRIQFVGTRPEWGSRYPEYGTTRAAVGWKF